MSYSGRRPFPKILITLGVLLISVLAVVLFAVLPTEEAAVAAFRDFGEFICANDITLIVILLAVNVVELADVIFFAKRDEVINANFVVNTSKNLSILAMFNHYFAGMTSNAPLFYESEEKASAIPRTVVVLVTNLVKFVAWVALMTMAMATIFKPAVYDYSIAEGADYSFTIFVLLLCLNCNVFVYALYRILPLHETRTYETVTYYSDGSIDRSTSISSNILAILLLSAFLYLFYTAYFVLPFASKIARSVETLRFYAYLKDSWDDENILDFYD